MRFQTRAGRISAGAVITAAFLILAFLAYARHPALDPVEPPGANGWHRLHGDARGPMAPVTEGTVRVPESDVRALTDYVVAGMASSHGARTGSSWRC